MAIQPSKKSFTEQRNDLLAKANNLIEARKAADQNLSDADRAALQSFTDQIKEIDAHLSKALSDKGLTDALAHLGSPTAPVEDGSAAGKSGYGFDSREGRITSASIKAAAHGLAGNIVREFPAVAAKASIALDPTSAGSVSLIDPIVGQPQIPTSLLDYLTLRPVSTPAFRYLRQKTRTNNAAVVPTGAEKPVSPMTFETIDTALKVVAHLSDPIDKYSLTDFRDLSGFVANELQWGLLSAVEQQIVNGNGTSTQLSGIATTSGIQTQAFSTDAITTARAAITALESLGYAPGAFVLRPDTWQAIELATSSGSGEYAFASSPVDRAERKLWGTKVLVSNAPAVKTGFLIGEDALDVWTDGGIQIETDKSEGFSRNEVRFRVEGRFQLAVKRPLAVVKMTTAGA